MNENTDKTEELVKTVLNFMKDNTEEELRTDDFAKEVNYSSKQLNRIFGQYSNKSVSGFYEELKLIDAVNYILAGNKLKDAALRYGYTEPGLSSAFKTRYGINIRDLKKDNIKINLYRDLEISREMKKIGDYTYELDKYIFADFLDSFTNINLIESFTGEHKEIAKCEYININLNLEKLLSYIANNIGHRICIQRSIVNQFWDSSAKCLIILLMNECIRNNDVQVSMPLEDIARNMFIFTFFYNRYNPIIENDYYIYTMDSKLKILINSLLEKKEVTNMNYGFSLSMSLNKKDKIILSIPKVY